MYWSGKSHGRGKPHKEADSTRKARGRNRPGQGKTMRGGRGCGLAARNKRAEATPDKARKAVELLVGASRRSFSLFFWVVLCGSQLDVMEPCDILYLAPMLIGYMMGACHPRLQVGALGRGRRARRPAVFATLGLILIISLAFLGACHTAAHTTHAV